MEEELSLGEQRAMEEELGREVAESFLWLCGWLHAYRACRLVEGQRQGRNPEAGALERELGRAERYHQRCRKLNKGREGPGKEEG